MASDGAGDLFLTLRRWEKVGLLVGRALRAAGLWDKPDDDADVHRLMEELESGNLEGIEEAAQFLIEARCEHEPTWTADLEMVYCRACGTYWTAKEWQALVDAIEDGRLEEDDP